MRKRSRTHCRPRVLDANSVDALYVLATAQMHEPDRPAAIASLERLLQLKPDFEPAYGMLCRALAEQGLLDRARAAIRQGLALNGRSHEFHFYLGNVEMAAGDLEGAVASYGRALALAPAFSEAHQNLGRALLASGRQQEAIDSLQRGVAAAPSSAQAHFLLGSAWQQLGQLEAAATQLSFGAGAGPAPGRHPRQPRRGADRAGGQARRRAQSSRGDRVAAGRCALSRQSRHGVARQRWLGVLPRSLAAGSEFFGRAQQHRCHPV